MEILLLITLIVGQAIMTFSTNELLRPCRPHGGGEDTRIVRLLSCIFLFVNPLSAASFLSVFFSLPPRAFTLTGGGDIVGIIGTRKYLCTEPGFSHLGCLEVTYLEEIHILSTPK